MINARLILNHSDEPQVLLYESGRYEQPIAIVDASSVKEWANTIDDQIRDLKKLRRARGKKKQ